MREKLTNWLLFILLVQGVLVMGAAMVMIVQRFIER